MPALQESHLPWRVQQALDTALSALLNQQNLPPIVTDAAPASVVEPPKMATLCQFLTSGEGRWSLLQFPTQLRVNSVQTQALRSARAD
jgi:hypothetical protein